MRPKGRQEENDIKRWLSVSLVALNAVVILFSLGIMGVGAYMQKNEWGSISDTYIADISTGMMLIGLLFVILSLLNVFGMYKQSILSGGKFVSGRHILIAHHLCIVVVVLFELYSLSWVMQSMSNLRHAEHKVGIGGEVQYGPLETQFSKSMNAIYFAASDCSLEDKEYSWFWNWIQDKCVDSGLQKMNCECGSQNGNSLCVVDKQGCGAGRSDVCPYDLCRLGAISYLSGVLGTLSYLGIGIHMFIHASPFS